MRRGGPCLSLFETSAYKPWVWVRGELKHRSSAKAAPDSIESGAALCLLERYKLTPRVGAAARVRLPRLQAAGCPQRRALPLEPDKLAPVPLLYRFPCS